MTRLVTLHDRLRTSCKAIPAELLDKLLDFFEAGRFPYDRLIQTYDFSDINTAIANTEAGDVIKPVLIMN